MKERLTWLQNNFINKELYAPLVVKNDADYLTDLSKKFKVLLEDAKRAEADDESIKIIVKYTSKIREAIGDYYKGRIITFHSKIKNLVIGCINNSLAVDTIDNSDAFGGVKGTEIQFFRARANENGLPFPKKEMLHIPFSKRGKTGNYRFSITGVPSLYLCNSTYACWLELGRPSEHDFCASPVVTDGTFRIFNLAVMNKDFHALDDLEKDRVHCWLKLLILMIATSYRIDESERIFKSEYIVSQSIMLACKELGLDGVAYYSKRVDDQVFAQAALNLALLAPYQKGKEYSDICKHIKIGESYNYAMFKQLVFANNDKAYDLRSLHTGYFNVIGDYDRQYTYAFTEFCRFDKFLFHDWKKEDIQFGNALEGI